MPRPGSVALFVLALRILVFAPLPRPAGASHWPAPAVYQRCSPDHGYDVLGLLQQELQVVAPAAAAGGSSKAALQAAAATALLPDMPLPSSPASMAVAAAAALGADESSSKLPLHMNATAVVRKVMAAHAASHATKEEMEAMAAHAASHATKEELEVVAPSSNFQAQESVSSEGGEEGAQTTTTAEAEYLGVSVNKEEDLAALRASLEINSGLCLSIVMVFCWLRTKYPSIYMNNVLEGFAPVATMGTSWFAWWGVVQDTTIEDAAASIGLDNALMLQFCDMAQSMMVRIGVPMVLITGPLNYAFGGNAAGDDRLSYLSMGNVENDSDLYYVHAIMVWYVVVIVCSCLHEYQKKFLRLRTAWLHTMPDNRANVVFVENIPEEYQSDKALYDFFDEMFPGRVQSAHMVRDTKELLADWRSWQNAKLVLEEANHHLQLTGERRTVRRTPLSSPEDKIEYYEKEVALFRSKVLDGRSDIIAFGKRLGPEGKHCPNGFVVFKNRQDAKVALHFKYFSDEELCYTNLPPCITDINWPGVKMDVVSSRGMGLVGMVLVVGLFIAYLPLVIGITNVANLVHLGVFQPVWKAFAPTMGLTIMVAMLPTFLVLILNICVTIHSDDAAQEKLHIWYFWFLVLFVILATALGQDINGLIAFFDTLATETGDIFMWFAVTLPYSTHFFLNYMVLQCTGHCLNLTRYVNLSKYLAFRAIYPEETARRMSEPEDQDYYGKGARAARWTVNLVIGIVYGTLSPPMNMAVWLNFFVQRNVVYGYLIPFAETKKADGGGQFWITMCHHVYFGLGLYWVLMVGVLATREPADAPYPHWIASPAILYLLHSVWTFQVKFSWRTLPHSEVMRGNKDAKLKFPHPKGGQYMQPELTEPVD